MKKVQAHGLPRKSSGCLHCLLGYRIEHLRACGIGQQQLQRVRGGYAAGNRFCTGRIGGLRLLRQGPHVERGVLGVGIRVPLSQFDQLAKKTAPDNLFKTRRACCM